MKVFLIFSIITISNTAMVLSTIVSKCTNVDAPLPLSVDVANCTASPCILYLTGLTKEMSMEFRTPRYLENIRPHAIVSIMGSKNSTYLLGQNDACDGITNTKCPLEEGELVDYSYEARALWELYPEVDLSVEFSILDLEQNNEPFVCFKIDINLKKPPV